MTRRSPLGVLLAAVMVALVVAGCGNRHEIQTLGETEGIYVDVGPLNYQVQMSRVLNPNDPEDAAYIKGLGPTVLPPAKDETWFAVFMRVHNPTAETQKPAHLFRIIDTQENVYQPMAFNREANPFAYQPDPLPAGGVYPDPNTISGEGDIQGSLLLFKVKLQSLQNRPLELKIDPPADAGSEVAGGTVDLDV